MEKLVAVAICTAHERRLDKSRPLLATMALGHPPDATPEQRGEMLHRYFITEARAAIRAMRAPTKAMSEAGSVVEHDDQDEYPEFSLERIYSAMIDAASPQEDTPE